ncbi:uncharacterized protein TNCV_3598621 [Trichonephila clavipes]|nr:uncharacterized protein TNCV_3598621 [Trichonephila clavipes]
MQLKLTNKSVFRPVLRSLRCLGDEVKLCIKMDVNQLAASENKTLSIIGNLFLSVGEFVAELCNNETDLRRNYLASVSCFKDLYEDPEPLMKCHRDGDAIYASYARSLDLLGEVQNEVREGEVSERWCMVSAYILACFTDNLKDRCGNVARATFVDALKRFHYLKWKECPDIDLVNIKTKFLAFLTLNEEKRSIYSEENKVLESVSTKRSSIESGGRDSRVFQDFKKIEPKFNLLCYPVTADIDGAPMELQLEFVIDEAELSTHDCTRRCNAVPAEVQEVCMQTNKFVHVTCLDTPIVLDCPVGKISDGIRSGDRGGHRT